MNKVYVVDIDHTLLEVGKLVAGKLDLDHNNFKDPTMHMDGVDYLKIQNTWNGQDSVYKDVIARLDRITSIQSFITYYSTHIFTDSVRELISDQYVVGVSSSFTPQGTTWKTSIFDKAKEVFNIPSHELIPSQLQTFASKEFECDSYKNIISRLQLLGFEVVCVDDNVTRLEWASELGCGTKIVTRPWNLLETRFERI